MERITKASFILKSLNIGTITLRFQVSQVQFPPACRKYASGNTLFHHHKIMIAELIHNSLRRKEINVYCDTNLTRFSSILPQNFA